MSEKKGEMYFRLFLKNNIANKLDQRRFWFSDSCLTVTVMVCGSSSEEMDVNDILGFTPTLTVNVQLISHKITKNNNNNNNNYNNNKVKLVTNTKKT